MNSAPGTESTAGPLASRATRHESLAPVAGFVAATLLLAWGISVFTVRDTAPEGAVLLIMLVPSVVALGVQRLGGQPVRATLVGAVRGTTGRSLGFGLLYPVAFVGVAGIVVLATGLAAYRPGAENAVVAFARQNGLLVLPVWILLNLIVTAGEELGWRGYLLPELAARWDRVTATALVGVVWALYHAPLIYLSSTGTGLGDPLVATAVQAAAVFTISFPFAYCYFLSEGSVVPVVLLHFVWNVVNPWVLGNVYSNAPGLLAGRPLLTSGEGVVGVAVGLVALVGFAVLLRRGRFVTGDATAQ